MRRRIAGAQVSSGQTGGSAGGVDDVFSTYLYEGNQAERRAIENGIDLAGEGGLVWTKSRSSGGVNYEHALTDTERGWGMEIQSNSSAAETGPDVKRLREFTSTGYVLGESYRYNQYKTDYVSWTFRKAPKFFDCVTYTGDGTSNRQIPHNLGSTPGFIVIKRTESNGNWIAWHKEVNPGYGILDSDFEFTAGANGFFDAVTDTYFETSWINTDGATFVAYVFAHDDSDESMIKCGSFNSASTITDVDLGWEPQWILAKASSGTGGWAMFDTQRGFSGSLGGNSAGLVANESNAEADFTNWAVNSRGFSYIETGSTRDFIYMAIRRPNKPAEEFEVEQLFNTVEGSGLNETPAFKLGFSPDMAWEKSLGKSSNYLGSRLQGLEMLYTDLSNPAAPNTNITWDHMDGWIEAFNGSESYNAWGFRRAPHFFDVVCYEGNNASPHDIKHGLCAVPQMIWIKSRSISKDWRVYSEQIGNTNSLSLNNDALKLGAGDAWADTDPTEDVFTVGSNSRVNSAGQSYIAYLFASVPGISDIGSYTGTGGKLDIDCGFTNGARFVLIKRTNGNGDWMYFDTLRGITSGSSPMLKLNEGDAEATGSYIKPLNSGFTVTSNLTGISGAEYIYMAIA